MIKHLKFIFILLILLAMTGCKDDPQRHIKLARWYAEKGLVDEAILEYREATRLLPHDTKAMNREEYELLAKAHYSLALMYTKKDWWNYALKEAETCFELLPTREHFEMLTLLKKRIQLEQQES